MKKVNVKPGVVFRQINEFYIEVAQALMEFSDYVPTITSGVDGTHMKTSYHYKDLALDIRTNDVKDPSKFREDLKLALPDCDVVLEKDHIHIEPSPGSKYVSV